MIADFNSGLFIAQNALYLFSNVEVCTDNAIGSVNAEALFYG